MGAQDPRTKFKTSDYEKQEQELPGLQSELTPQPDCGETSYEGHNRLLDYKMLVTGGDSAIGRAQRLHMPKKGQTLQLTIFQVKNKMLKKLKPSLKRQDVKLY